ncbi:hypothetical protein LCGC14_2250490, partial [marine sediment metagenome]
DLIRARLLAAGAVPQGRLSPGSLGSGHPHGRLALAAAQARVVLGEQPSI